MRVLIISLELRIYQILRSQIFQIQNHNRIVRPTDDRAIDRRAYASDLVEEQTSTLRKRSVHKSENISNYALQIEVV